MDTATPLERELLTWITEWNEGLPGDGIGPETELLADGLLDSLGLAGLITHIEDRTEKPFDYETFDPSGSVTVRGLLRGTAPDGD